MRQQAFAQEDSTPTLSPAIRPRMPWRVAEVRALDGFRLWVRFIDGTEGSVDMAPLVRSATAGVFAALANPECFQQVRVEHGAVTWPGELDLAPDAMHAAIRASGIWVPA